MKFRRISLKFLIPGVFLAIGGWFVLFYTDNYFSLIAIVIGISICFFGEYRRQHPKQIKGGKR